MMNIAQAGTTLPPIEQIISWLNLPFAQTHRLPGLQPGYQARAVQKLPVRVDEQAAGLEQLVGPADNLFAQLQPWQVVKHPPNPWQHCVPVSQQP